MMKLLWLAYLFMCYFTLTFASKYERKDGNFGDELVPKIYEMQIESNISNRFAQTLITSKVQNWNKVAREATFSIILPEKAYISEFVMVSGGRSYKAYVKEKQQAKNIYDQAVASGLGAVHVARESERFTVSMNLEALAKATFLLKYEELLRLKENTYQLIINIHPTQPVKDLSVKVMINESKPLKYVRIPTLRSGNEITKLEGQLDPRANITRSDSKSALVQFKPNIEKQNELAKYLGTDVSKGLSGQFVVQYDVERDPQGGEVLVKDGYFVHFFAPSELKPLNKFVVFVLETSKNMNGRKIFQLLDAMFAILNQLDPNDYFHIVSFAGKKATVWNIINPGKSPKRFGLHNVTTFPKAFSGHPDNIKRAKKVLTVYLSDCYEAGTNIYDALHVALNLVEVEKTYGKHEHLPQPMIMLLTAGKPNVEVLNTERIIRLITNQNVGKTPIYTLSFGDRADKNFLRKLSLKNHGFSRHIYEASDAALQLENFYKEIASPLLSGVKFEYVPEATSLTKTKFPLHFGGSEIVVAGRLGTSTFPELPRILSKRSVGQISLPPTIERPVTSLERLWAYLTVQNLLEQSDMGRNKEVNRKKALNLALKYSLVTPVTSLIVAKPNSKDCNIDPTRIPIPRSKIASVLRSHFGRHSGRSISRLSSYLNSNDYRDSPVFFKDHDDSDEADFKIGNKDFNFRNDKLNYLKSALPWLGNHLNENGTLKSPPGGYELGLYRTFSKKPSCSETPMNTTGQCELLQECPQVHHLLTTADVFGRHFCPLKRRRKQFAGVCCP